MTAKDLLGLCMMAYLDLPPLHAGIIKRGGSVPVAAFADSVIRMDAAGIANCAKLTDNYRNIAREMMNSDAVIADYINDNAGSGFVGYVVKSGDETVIVMRGSETPGECTNDYYDWVDNVCEPFSGSAQTKVIEKIIREYDSGKVIFTGHSKGGHNALAALAISDNNQATAAAFNGQGFGEDALDEWQKRKLWERGVNYVVADDVVGAIMEHPEKRVYVRKRDGANAHMPDAFVFDEYGDPVRAVRSAGSLAVEALTRIAERRFRGRGRSAVTSICRRAMGLRG